MYRDRDLFSQLSIDLIHIILSFLITPKKGRFVDTKEATRTAILSKKFLQAWYTFPDLYFSEKVFSKYLYRIPANAKHAQLASMARERFANFVLHRVKRYQEHNIPIRRLHISAQVTDNAANIFDQSILQANENGLQEIYLHMVLIRPSSLIQTIFALKQLVSLILCYCELVNKGVKYCNIFVNCVSLRKLKLKRVRINDELLQKLIYSCPLIEEIKIVCCKGLENIQIANLPFLKRLKVYTAENERVVVKVESLEFMKFGNYSFHNIKSAQNLKVLKLRWADMGDDDLDNITAKCPVLKELTLINCDEIEKIKVSSRSLSFLSIIFCRHLMEVKIDAPILNIFEYYGERVLSPLSFASGGSEKRKSSVTLYWSDDSPEEASFLELSVFLMTLKHSDNILLEIRSTEIAFDRSMMDGLRDENNIPEFEEVYITVSSPSSTYSALMEGLLWSCSPRIISVKRDSKEDDGFIRHLFEELLVQHDDDDHQNNSTSASDCWRNYFKRAKLNDGDDGWLPLHSWKSLANVMENLGDHYILKFSRD